LGETQSAGLSNSVRLLPPLYWNVGRRGVVLVGDLVEHVVQVVHGVDDLAHVRFLNRRDLLVGQLVHLQALAVTVGVAVDAIDVIAGMKRMALPGAFGELHGPALEEHHGDVDAPLAGCAQAAAEPVEIDAVILGQIELRLAVEGLSRPGPRKRLRRGGVDAFVPPLGVPSDRLPGPQPDEVVAEPFEAIEVGGEVERRRGIARPDVDQVRPGMRAGQIDRFAGPVGEVAGVLRVSPQRALGGRTAAAPATGLRRGGRVGAPTACRKGDASRRTARGAKEVASIHRWVPSRAGRSPGILGVLVCAVSEKLDVASERLRL